MASSTKARESGMLEEATRASYFDADAAIDRLAGTDGVAENRVEFGCGYGTFTIPEVPRTHGIVAAPDIEPRMVNCVRQKAKELVAR